MRIVGVDAPNKQQAPFGDELFRELLDDCQSKILMMGEFNKVIDGNLVESRESSTPGLPLSFHMYKKCLHMVDVWW